MCGIHYGLYAPVRGTCIMFKLCITETIVIDFFCCFVCILLLLLIFVFNIHITIYIPCTVFVCDQYNNMMLSNKSVTRKSFLAEKICCIMLYLWHKFCACTKCIMLGGGFAMSEVVYA